MLNGNSADTLQVVNNTFFCVNAYIVFFQDDAYCKYLQFEHNTVFLTAANPMWIFLAINADIKNNIFYGTMVEQNNYRLRLRLVIMPKTVKIPSTIDIDTLLDLASQHNLLISDRQLLMFKTIVIFSLKK